MLYQLGGDVGGALGTGGRRGRIGRVGDDAEGVLSEQWMEDLAKGWD